MFVENEESNLVWFSGIKAESSSFDLVGKLAGLAVYNSVLAFFPFPLAIYKVNTCVLPDAFPNLITPSESRARNT